MGWGVVLSCYFAIFRTPKLKIEAGHTFWDKSVKRPLERRVPGQPEYSQRGEVGRQTWVVFTLTPSEVCLPKLPDGDECCNVAIVISE